MLAHALSKLCNCSKRRLPPMNTNVRTTSKVALVLSCPLYTSLPSFASVVVLAVENSQDGEEKVDDIEVKADGSSNLLFNVVVSHDHLCINKNIT